MPNQERLEACEGSDSTTPAEPLHINVTEEDGVRTLLQAMGFIVPVKPRLRRLVQAVERGLANLDEFEVNHLQGSMILAIQPPGGLYGQPAVYFAIAAGMLVRRIRLGSSLAPACALALAELYDYSQANDVEPKSALHLLPELLEEATEADLPEQVRDVARRVSRGIPVENGVWWQAHDESQRPTTAASPNSRTDSRKDGVPDPTTDEPLESIEPQPVAFCEDNLTIGPVTIGLGRSPRHPQLLGVLFERPDEMVLYEKIADATKCRQYADPSRHVQRLKTRLLSHLKNNAPRQHKGLVEAATDVDSGFILVVEGDGLRLNPEWL